MNSTTYNKNENVKMSGRTLKKACSIASELRETLAFHGHSRGAARENDVATI
jgi:hypothetical protein